MADSSTQLSPLYAAMPRLYYHHDQLWAETPENFLDQLDHDFDYRTDDIWLSSYPRSGTAWTYEVLYAVLYGGDMAALQQAQREEKIRRFGSLEVGTAASVLERFSSWMTRPYGTRRWEARHWRHISTCRCKSPRLPCGGVEA